jgi:hypothetical protein
MLKQEGGLADSRGALFTIGAFIFGGMVSRPGVFFAPLIKEFGWSHARVSSLASAITLGTIPGSQASARGALLELAPTGATFYWGAHSAPLHRPT